MSEESPRPPQDDTPPPAPADDAPGAEQPPGPPPAGGQQGGADKKLVAGILGILIGSLGIHKFYLGYQKEGIITCGAAAAVMGIIGLVEGIMYLTKSDEEFASTYIQGKKGWF